MRVQAGGWAFGLLCLALTVPDSGAGDAVQITVSPWRLVVNGQPDVPRGIFGVHATGLTPAFVDEYGIECIRQIHYGPGSNVSALDKDGKVKPPYERLSVVIDCMGDRYTPATVLVDKDYEAKFKAWGTEYGRKCAAAGWPGFVEFWNEPYLNWAERSRGSRRNNYWAEYYEVAQAVENGPVTIKGWDQPLRFMKWRRLWAAYDRTKAINDKNKNFLSNVVEEAIAWSVPIPTGLKPGDTFVDTEKWYWTDRTQKTFRVVERWEPYDAAAEGWWSGPQNLDFYLWMFLPFAQAVKEANPDVKVIGGWDFNPSVGDWSLWRQIHVPLIDASIQWLDGVTDHHYGVNTREVTAWYEVATAYTWQKHGKWIRNYNTECGGTLDPAVHGLDAVDATNQPAIQKQAGQAVYALRDMMELLHHCPDKVGSRTAHHAGGEPGVLAVFKLLRELRGPLVKVESGDPDVWPVAALNSNRVVLAVFNNERAPRTLALDLPPAPDRCVVSRIVPRADGDGVTVESTETNLAQVAEGFALGGWEAVVFTLGYAGAETWPERRRSQHFAREGVLLRPTANTGLELTIETPSIHGQRPTAAYLQVTGERITVPVRVRINGHAPEWTLENWTQRRAIPHDWLAATNRIQFHVQDGDAGIFQVDAASLVVDWEDATHEAAAE